MLSPTRILLVAASLALSASPAAAFRAAPIAAGRIAASSHPITALHASEVGEERTLEQRILVEGKERREREAYERANGHVQELGRTVKKDGLDGLRAFVWALFGVSNYVFPALGVAYMVQLGCTIAGYGFYLDLTEGMFAFDTMENIRLLAATSADGWVDGMLSIR